MFDDRVKFFKALGNETRLQIVESLLKNEYCACDFARISDKDQTTVSRHLRVLTEAGITRFKKSGRNIIYEIKDNTVRRRLISMGLEPQGECPDDCQVSRNEYVKGVVEKKYSRIALEGGSCGCGSSCCGDEAQDPIQISRSLGYTEGELESVPESNLGLGCGNPVALGEIREGDVVLDLGSGAGLDAFLAAKKVGGDGRVIGVDLSEEMVKRAWNNARKYGFDNVEFRHGDIEDLPLDKDSIDVILSNCVINLTPEKSKVFAEAFRVLRPQGRMYISDIVLLEELTEEQKMDEELISGCVGGAILRDEYLMLMRDAGFDIERILEDDTIGEGQYNGLPVESLKIVARKRGSADASRDG